jgi:hypothetical protein
LRSGVSKACRYDPDLNPSYQQLAAHYQVAVLPARPYKPKDYVLPKIMCYPASQPSFCLTLRVENAT